MRYGKKRGEGPIGEQRKEKKEKRGFGRRLKRKNNSGGGPARKGSVLYAKKKRKGKDFRTAKGKSAGDGPIVESRKGGREKGEL